MNPQPRYMNKTFLIVPLLLLASFKGFCYDVYIKYTITNDSTYTKHKTIDYFFKIVKGNWDRLDLNSQPTVPWEVKTVTNKPGYEVDIVKYTLQTSGLYLICDNWGHQVFFDKSMQNDTIELVVTQLIHTLRLNDSVTSRCMFKMSYPEKYKYMGFIDSLAYLYGDLRDPMYFYSVKAHHDDLKKYLDTVNAAYKSRMDFLNRFANHYYMPPKIREYAYKEIQYAYYSDLFEPTMDGNTANIGKYPKSLVDTINQIAVNINDENGLENSSLFKKVLRYHVSTFNTTGGGWMDKLDSNYCVNRLQYCKKNLSNKVQGYALAWFMDRFFTSGQKELFDLVYKNYDRKTSGEGVNKFVDSIKSMASNSKLLPAEVLAFSFEDKDHVSHQLSELINKRYVLIDCWATWCMPCLQQLPYLDSLADVYKDKVQFISISADNFGNKWDKWMANKSDSLNKNILQLHAVNGFENIFFKRLMITAIPRYIFINKDGEIIDASAPRPSEPELRSLLEKCLKK